MQIQSFKGYREGQDILQIPTEYLTYPSKNCVVYKGKVVSRLGIKNDGTAHTENTKVHSEYVWKKAPGGAKRLRVWGTTIQVKWKTTWITLFTGLSANTKRVRFTSWVDTNGAIIKNRLFMVDGSDKIYEWNGAMAEIDSAVVDDDAKLVRIKGLDTLMQLGFDPGDATTQSVQIVGITDGLATGTATYTYTDTLANNDRVLLVETPDPTHSEGDLLMSNIVQHTDKLAGIDKDELYVFKNQIYVANLRSGRITHSDAITFDFAVPATLTATSAGFINLDGFFTAMIERKGILWISTSDDWFKISKEIEENVYGFFTKVEKFEQAESIGAKPFAVAIQKGDVVFMAQDKLLRRIITLDILGIDDIELISDQIDGLLNRLELDDVRIYYFQRYIYIISANEGIVLMLDVLSGEYMPPQYIGMSCMSVIDAKMYGHSNSRNESFELFTGRNDLGGQIEVVVAPGFVQGKQPFAYKKHDLFGIHARSTETSVLAVDYQYEEFGAGALKPISVPIKEVTTYHIDPDVSFGGTPFGTHSFIGVDDNPDTSLKGFFLFDRQDMVSWFNFRPVFKVSGSDVEFHLLGWYINEEMSDDNIEDELFINREQLED